ncbi:MAG: phosphotransferase family protein [Acidimicrobiia bacterium]
MAEPAGAGYDVELTDVRPGQELDVAALETFLRAHVTALDGVEGEVRVRQFPHGSANLTYLVAIGPVELVVRRPPFGRLAPGAHDMRREHRALAGLAGCFDRVARPLAFCDDPSVLGADFLVVEYRRGVVVWDHVPPAMVHHGEVARRVGFAVVDALADLHGIAPDAAGLADLGRPEGYVARQVEGWRRRWDLVDTGRVRAMAPLGARLAAARPAGSRRAAVLHNDYKLDNCQFDPSAPDRVATIFDWDMATLGDPLCDLGALLNYWPDPADLDGDRPLHVPGLEHLGLPSRVEVVERYAARTGEDVSGVAWYEAFATWRTAVILEQLHQRWVRGETSDPRMAERGEPVARLAARTARLLDRLGPRRP